MAPQQARLVLVAVAGLLALAGAFVTPLSASAEDGRLGIGIVSYR